MCIGREQLSQTHGHLPQTHGHRQVTYRARWIIRPGFPPLRNGWLSIVNDRILGVGSGKPSETAIELGNVAVLPALVNAHTHLEFSDLDQPIGLEESSTSIETPGQAVRHLALPLHLWIGEVIRSRGERTEQQRRDAISKGLEESIACGVGLIGEIATLPLSAEMLAAFGEVSDRVSTTLLGEVIGLSRQRADDKLRQAQSLVAENEYAGYSPHAPYSLHQEVLLQTLNAASLRSRPVAMHIAESPHERELLLSGGGPMADALNQLGVLHDRMFPWPNFGVDSSSLYCQLIDRLAVASNGILVHGNDLQSNEIQQIAEHKHLTVVYCPRTHAAFGYDPHPVDQMLQAECRIALGTDSRASNPDLNLWSEVQFLLNHRQDIPPEAVIEMATINGSIALGSSFSASLRVGDRFAAGIVETDSDSLDSLYRDLAFQPYQPLV